MSIKQCLYNKCKEFIDERLKVIQHSINGIQKSLLSETKSSAGDKHETGRAMLQLEREKAGQQLAEINKTNAILLKVNLEEQSNVVSLGSIVYTTHFNYFIAISAGEFIIDNCKFYAISPNTPIGKLLIGKTTDDEVSFREESYKILKVI